jgi:hypothetical protein
MNVWKVSKFGDDKGAVIHSVCCDDGKVFCLIEVYRLQDLKQHSWNHQILDAVLRNFNFCFPARTLLFVRSFKK